MPSRYFALVPAAGHSIRMGQPKLLLPLFGQPVIAHTLARWQQSVVDRVVVVVRADDVPLADLIRTRPSIDLVIPAVPPPDMKASLRSALDHLAQQESPTADDAFLVAPADMPRLSPAIVDRLIARHQGAAQKTILAPSLHGKRGHPVLFPWPLAAEVFALGLEEGLDVVVHRHAPVLVPCEDLLDEVEYPFADIDTPEDFRRMTYGE